jgi:hypothetical protein
VSDRHAQPDWIGGGSGHKRKPRHKQKSMKMIFAIKIIFDFLFSFGGTPKYKENSGRCWQTGKMGRYRRGACVPYPVPRDRCQSGVQQQVHLHRRYGDTSRHADGAYGTRSRQRSSANVARQIVLHLFPSGLRSGRYFHFETGRCLQGNS